MSTGREALLVEPGRFEVRNRDWPDPPPGSVLVRMAEVGICGSDLRVFGGEHALYPFPVTLGHEGWGHVDGDAARRVAVFPLIGCGQCPACDRDDPSLCPQVGVVGGHTQGGLATWLPLPAANVIGLPSSVPDDVAALVEPTAAAVRAVRRAAVAPGDTVAVLGLGPIGLLVALLARRAGASVFVAGHNAERQRLAQACGLDCLGETLPAGATLADVAFACAPGPSAASAVIDCVRPGGRAVLVASGAGDLRVSGNDLYRWNRSILGSAMYEPDDFAAAADALAAGLIPADLVEDGIRVTFPLEDVQQVFEAVRDRTLVRPQADRAHRRRLTRPPVERENPRPVGATGPP